jgi:hypothetical protein
METAQLEQVVLLQQMLTMGVGLSTKGSRARWFWFTGRGSRRGAEKEDAPVFLEILVLVRDRCHAGYTKLRRFLSRTVKEIPVVGDRPNLNAPPKPFRRQRSSPLIDSRWY